MASGLKKIGRLIEGAAGTAAMQGVGLVGACCPDAMVRPLGRKLGRLIWRLSGRYRAVAIKNLEFVYGNELTGEQIRDLALEVFEHFGQVMVEFFWMSRQTPKSVLEMVKPSPIAHERLDAAMAAGRGAIVITGHYGNWELFARWLVASGYKLNVVARDSDNPAQAAFVNALREKGGYRVFSRGDSTSQLLQALADNQLLAILPDQNTIHRPLFVPFFGRLASVANGVGLLSLRSGAPVLPGFLRRTEGPWEIDTYPEIRPPEGASLDEAVLSVSAQFTKVIETQIRSCPEQWLWFHDRWRKRPPDE